MNCELAEILVMKHMEQTILPGEKEVLHTHMTECDSCREYYLAFDEVLEYAANENTLWIETPANFTANVMGEIKKAQPALENEKVRSSIGLHILWGASAILLGVALFFMYNPAYFTNLTELFPTLANISAWVARVWAAIARTMDSILQSQQTIETSIGVTALAMVLVMAILLVVLHRSEKVTH